ncbi:MAG TPA: amidohydrolase [Gemmatimonadales bacterium]|nr:amidohydrolase [Gemmatimonadales bacterium]
MILSVMLALAGLSPASDSILVRVERQLRAQEARLIAFRRDIHQHPEVSLQEKRTAGKVAERLKELGLEVRTGVGGHGVVAFIRGAKPGPLVAYRADMDAVPSNDPDPVEFKSLTPGVRHICGHDLHTTIGVAIAEGLAAQRKDLPGSIMLIFQPAEERVLGAKAMLADGVFGKEKPVAIYGVHTAPLNVGQLGTRPGPMMAAIDAIRITVSGNGNKTVIADSIVRHINALSTLTLQDALRDAGGQDMPVEALMASAVARPGEGRGLTIQGQISSASANARAAARRELQGYVAGLHPPGVDVQLKFEERFASGVSNDARLMERANTVIRGTLGDESVVTVPVAPPVFSEDYGFFTDQVPGVFWFLGVSNPAKGTVGMPHSPGYVADEGAILVAARAMTAVLLDRLNR